MPLGDPYVDSPTVKARFQIDDTVDDALIVSAADAASRAVETFCRRQFNSAGTATARLYRPKSPLRVDVDDFSTTDGLVVETDDDDGTFSTLWAASEFEVQPINGIVSGQPGWPFWRIVSINSRRFPHLRRAAVRVTAQWGWTKVPDPVVDATAQIAAELFKRKDAPFGVAGFDNFGAVRVQAGSAAWKMLKPYRADPVLVA